MVKIGEILEAMVIILSVVVVGLAIALTIGRF